MDLILGILTAVAVFFSAVLFHEIGHFLFARFFGMKVEEFGIGIPPKARTIVQDAKGTTYTLNWLPIGGFVRIRWEDALTADAKHPDSFSSKSYPARAMVLLAGVAFNFILAFLIFLGLFWQGIAPLAINSRFETVTETRLVPNFEQAISIGMVKVSGVTLSPVSGSVSERAGIREGDRIIEASGRSIRSPEEFISWVRTSSEQNVPLAVVISRSGAVLHFSLLPENGKIGAYVAYSGVEIDRNFRYQHPFSQAVEIALQETYAQTLFTFELLGKIGQKLVFPRTEEERREAASGLGGPIAVGGLFVELQRSQVPISVILTVAALLSINLGAFNLLPLPALDGGRFFLMTLAEPLRRSGKIRIIRTIEASIHSVGFIFFIFLAIVIAFHDIAKFF